MPAQRGVALVTALLIVALAATAAALLSVHHQIEIRRSGNVFAGDQAYQYALGAEPWAMHILAQDARDSKIDSLNEEWATILPPLDIPGGSIAGYIIDLQGQFNLNSVVNDEGKVDPLAYERLQRLLSYAGAEGNPAEAVVDWIDPDIDPTGTDGAEDDYYLGLERPYRAADRAMASPSELRLVRGITPEVYSLLISGVPEEGTTLTYPLIATLPARTSVNINTAPIGVLVALGLSEDSARTIAQERIDSPFEDVKTFLSRPEVKDTPLAKDGAGDGLSVSSSYFLLYAEARIERARAQLYSVLHRDQQGIMHVVMRSQGTR